MAGRPDLALPSMIWDGWRAWRDLGPSVLKVRLGAARPFKITLALTDRCDCRCLGCLIWEKPKGREPTPVEIERILGGLPWLRWVNLTGGEPFLRDDMVEVVEAVRRAVPRLAVLDFPTTGQRTERIIDDVRAMGRMGIPRVLVTVSLEGPPSLHDRLRGREGAFARMARTYAALRDIPGVDAYLGMTLTEENASRVDEALAAVRAAIAPRRVKPTDVHFNVWTHSPHYYANTGSEVRAPRDLDRMVARFRRSRESSFSPVDRVEATYLRLLPAYLRMGRSPVPCRSLRASLFVQANGDVFPCTVWDRKLGNAFEKPLRDILATEAAARARRTIARDACPGCWSPCEAFPSIVAGAPESLLKGVRDVRRGPR